MLPYWKICVGCHVVVDPGSLTGELLKTCVGHEGEVYALDSCRVAQGPAVLSCGVDMSIHMWGIRDVLLESKITDYNSDTD